MDINGKKVQWDNVKDLIEDKAARNADSVLMHSHETTVTYSKANKTANRLANALLSLGIRKGDRVCTLLGNSSEHVWIWFALAKIGAIWNPLSTFLKGKDLLYAVRDSAPSAFFVDDDSSLIEKYLSVRSSMNNLKIEAVVSKGKMAEDLLPIDELLQKGGDDNPSVKIGPGDPMGMIYTSGTTGLPKGVVLPHFSYILTGLHFSKITGISKNDRLFSALPLFHCGGQHVLVLPALLNDIDFAMTKKFSASQFWTWVRQFGATILVCAGSIVPMLYKQEQKRDDSDNPVRLIWNAGTPKEMWRDFEKRFDLRIVEVYGLTETGCAFTSSTKVGTVGKIDDFRTVVEIFNERDEALGHNQRGEIVVRPTRPYSMMLGYHNNPDAVVKDWRNLWFHTGVIGYKDEHGFLHFLERKAHFIRRRGENVSAFEVESTINECPKVVESAVVGVPAELGEEEIKAYIMLKDGQEMEPGEIIDWCSQKIAYFKVPRYIEFVTSLPKTPTNRVERYKLKRKGTGNAWDREKAGHVVKK